MISIIDKILGALSKLTAKDILYLIIICLLSWVLYSQWKTNREEEARYETNITAFTDSVSYYKSKCGDLVATKTLFECNIKELEKCLLELENIYKSMPIGLDEYQKENYSFVTAAKKVLKIINEM